MVVVALLLASSAGPAEAAQRVRGLHWTFHDVEINSLLARLKRFGVEVPVPVAGQVTVRLSVGVPSWRSILRTTAYQIDGQIESNKLTVAGFDLHQLAAHLIYHEGTLQLTSLRFGVPRPDGAEGTVSGSAKVQVRPRGDLTANVSLERIPLSALAGVVPQLAGLIEGDAGGHVSAEAPLDKLRDLSAWRGEGHLSLEHITALQMPPAEVIADVRLTGGQATLSNLIVKLERLRLTGSGALALAAPFEYSAQLRLNAPDLGWLAGLAPEFRPPVDVGGQLTADAAVKGKIQPREFQARGTLVGRALKAGRIRVERLQVPYNVTADADAWSGQGQFALRNAAAYGLTLPQASLGLRLGEGALSIGPISVISPVAQVTGSASLKLQTPFDFKASLSIANVDLAQSNRLPEGLRAPLRVGGRLGVSADVRGSLQPLKFAARGAVAARRIQVGQAVFDRVDFHYDVTDERVSLSRIAVAAYQGRLTGSVSGPLGDSGDAQVALTWQRMNVARMLADLDLVEPLRGARVEGWSNGSVNAKASGQLADLDRWQGQAEVLLWALQLDQFTLRRAALAARLADGKLTLSKIEADEGPLRLNASAQIALADGFDFGATVRLRRADLALLNGLPPRLRPPVNIAGTAHVSADVRGTLDPPRLTQGEVDATLAGVSVLGWTGASARFKSRVRDGALEITELSARQGATTLRGGGQIRLDAPFDYEAKLTIDNVDLAKANTLPGVLRPPVKLAGRVGLSIDARGTLDPLLLTGAGSLNARDLEADGAKIDRVALDFSAEKDRLSISRLLVELYGGRIEGDATVPLDTVPLDPVPLDPQGAGRIAIGWSEIDVGGLATDVARPPVRLSGKIDGSIKAEIPAGKLAQVENWNIDATFDAPQLKAETVVIGALHGRLEYRDGVARYELTGEALLGRLQLAGVWQPAPPGGRPGLNEGHLQLTGARLAALSPLLRRRGAGDTLSGTVGIEVKYRHDPATGQPLGSGDLTLNDVQYEGIDLLDEVHGQIRMLPGQMEVANVTGIVAGGQLLGSATVFLEPGRRSTFLLALNGAQAADLLGLWPQLASQARGTIDTQLRGFFGVRRPIYVNGAAAIRQGHFDGIEYSGVRMPIAGVIDPTSGTGQLHLHGTTAQVALGRVVGDFDVTMTGGGIDLNGKGKFTRVDLRTLLRRMASARRLGSGKISGKFTLAGRNVRSIRDLTGTVDADLTNAQAMSFPVLQGVLPFLTGGISGSTTFDQGDLRARLAGGVIRIDEFSLSSNAAQLYARGTVSLAGRLNLNVTVNTGQLDPSTRAVSVLAARIALFTAPPVALLLEASQFLSNQVINVEVTGTVRSPTVRIRPLPLLEQEVIQFFLLQAPGV